MYICVAVQRAVVLGVGWVLGAFCPLRTGAVKPSKCSTLCTWKICFSSKGIVQDGANVMYVSSTWEGSGKPLTGMRQMAYKSFTLLCIMKSAVPSRQPMRHSSEGQLACGHSGTNVQYDR